MAYAKYIAHQTWIPTKQSAGLVVGILAIFRQFIGNTFGFSYA